MVFHLHREDGSGIAGAAEVARAMRGNSESVVRLARILYNYYDGKDDSANAVMFNNLVTEWPEIQKWALDPDRGTQSRMATWAT